MKADLSSIQTKILPVLFGLILTGISLMAVSSLLKGARTNFLFTVFLVLGVALVLVLDKYYWIVIPIALAIQTLPFLPFKPVDLACLIVIAVYSFRLVVGKENSIKITPIIVLASLPFCWILLVWFLNPTGLNILGSSTVGLRYYITICLSFLSFLILTTLRVDERKSKILYYSLFISYIFTLIKNIITVNYFGSVNLEDLEGLNFRGRYEFLPAMYLFVLLYAKYDLKKIFTSIGLFVALFCCFYMVVFSGKRLGLFLVGITPLFKVLVYKKQKLLTFVGYFLVVFFLLFAVAADGVAYDLPISVKRGLSIVVPKYRQNMVEGVQDEFRYQVRLRAKDIIKESKLFGRKGYALNASDVGWLYSQRNNIDYVVSTGGWHNTWLAFACDFGVVSAILWALFLLYLIPFLYKSARDTQDLPYTTSCLFFYLVLLYIPIILSNTTGHVANTTQSFWISSGLVCALVNGYNSKQEV